MKIDLFLHQRSQYAVLDYFTIKVEEALKRAGVKTKMHHLESRDPRPFLDSIRKERPDYTLSFNGILPDSEGRFLCDMIGISHIACLVDSPAWFLPLKDSSLTHVTCVDRSHVDFFRHVGKEHVSFMTQACDINLKPKGLKKEFDVTFLCSYIDLEQIESGWKAQYSEKMVLTLHHAADIALRDPNVSYWQAFSEGMSIHQPPDTLDLITLVHVLKELERYINGKDRLDLLRHLTHVTIDVFGAEGGWNRCLKDLPHIRLHPPVPFEEHFSILERSRITINALAKIRQGGSERVFNALALNTLPLTSVSNYLNEFYQDQKSLLTYTWGSWKSAEEKIQTALNDPTYYTNLIANGRDITLKSHTWDNRVCDLLKTLKR